MAHFRGTIQGRTKQTSRLGTKNSGIKSDLNGLGIGVESNIYHISSRGNNGEDIVEVYITCGSNKLSKYNRIYVGSWKREGGQIIPCNSLGGSK